MHQYYSQEGSRSLPESTRQTDCLFLVGPDIRASCWLWKCGFVIGIQNNPENSLIFSSFASVCLMWQLPPAAHP